MHDAESSRPYGLAGSTVAVHTVLSAAGGNDILASYSR